MYADIYKCDILCTMYKCGCLPVRRSYLKQTSSTDNALQKQQYALDKRVSHDQPALFSTMIQNGNNRSGFTWRFTAQVFIFSLDLSHLQTWLWLKPQPQKDTWKWKMVEKTRGKTAGCLTPCLFVWTAVSVTCQKLKA